MNTLAKKVPIKRNSRIKTYYDTRDIIDTTSVLNFFPANPDRDTTRNNYFNNPFPGTDKRRVVGLSFELPKQFISTATDIDPLAIVNGLKDAGVIITADNSNTEFLRAPLSHFFNFGGTGLNRRLAIAGNPTSDAATETIDEATVTMKSSGMYRLPDPFDIATNQTVDVKVEFESSASFPTAAQWTTSEQGQLSLKAKLYVAEIRTQ